jgi:hypothetical protein
MLYHITTYRGKNMMAQATVEPPFGPGFSRELAETADCMEVWGTTIKHSGPDYTQFRLLDVHGKMIEAKNVSGY